MKAKNALLIFVIILAVVFAFTGCGSRNDDSSEAIADETPKEPEPEVVQQEITQKIVEEADTKTTEDVFAGKWAGVDDPSLFVNITKDGDKYVYEDNDGKYDAEFADGVLKVTVAENDFATVYVDKDSGNLVLTYMDNIIEYKKD
jgi:hypothetical protein